jgi:ribosomal protein S15P/S13E
MLKKQIEELKERAEQNRKDYRNLVPTKKMEVDAEDILWMIAEIYKLRKAKETNAKILRALVEERRD